jgi:hypothetical protein
MVKLFALVYQIILEVLQLVDQNVLRIPTVHLLKPVPIKNVVTLVLVLVELQRNV